MAEGVTPALLVEVAGSVSLSNILLAMNWSSQACCSSEKTGPSSTGSVSRLVDGLRPRFNPDLVETVELDATLRVWPRPRPLPLVLPLLGGIARQLKDWLVVSFLDRLKETG